LNLRQLTDSGSRRLHCQRGACAKGSRISQFLARPEILIEVENLKIAFCRILVQCTENHMLTEVTKNRGGLLMKSQTLAEQVRTPR
jgi:hypothetical protein